MESVSGNRDARGSVRAIDNFAKYILLPSSTRKWSPINFSRNLKEEAALLPVLKYHGLADRFVGRYCNFIEARGY